MGGAPDDPSAGNEGVYTFESLKPVARGEFNVTGEHADFLTVSKAVVVQANDFLNVTPSSIEACNDERSISLANNIDLNASVMLT